MKADILSEVLQSVRLSGAIFFDVSASEPWVASAPPAAALAPMVMPESQHVIEYHVITSGHGWATLLDGDGAPIRLAPGSIIVFPQGDRHVLASQPDLRSDPDLSVFDQPKDIAPPFYIQQFGGGPETTSMICGFIGCDLFPFNPIINGLPRMIHVPNGYTRGDGWLRGLIQAIGKESRQRRVGSQSVLSKLSELLFIEVIRCHMESLPKASRGWIAALADPRMARSLQLLHEDPARAWNLEDLARETAVSRTILVKLFKEHLGLGPMSYLTNWRMQLAAGLLAGRGSTIARVAAKVGYESEAAFSRAFKRATQVAPGSWRKIHQANR